MDPVFPLIENLKPFHTVIVTKHAFLKIAPLKTNEVKPIIGVGGNVNGPKTKENRSGKKLVKRIKNGQKKLDAAPSMAIQCHLIISTDICVLNVKCMLYIDSPLIRLVYNNDYLNKY